MEAASVMRLNGQHHQETTSDMKSYFVFVPAAKQTLCFAGLRFLVWFASSKSGLKKKKTKAVVSLGRRLLDLLGNRSGQ